MWINSGTNIPEPIGSVYECLFDNTRVYNNGDIGNGTNQHYGRRIWANVDTVSYPGSANDIFVENCRFKSMTQIILLAKT